MRDLFYVIIRDFIEGEEEGQEEEEDRCMYEGNNQYMVSIS